MHRSVAILVFPGAQALDVSGPLDVFAEANRFLLPEDHYQLEIIGTEPGPLACSNGMLLQPHRTFTDAAGAADASGAGGPAWDLLLAAGGPVLPTKAFPAALYTWLRQASQRARRFGSICNGAFLLAGAGLLDGRTVTTHWNDVAALAARCPGAQVEADRIYAQDGNLYTSAGVTAGIDLSLFLLAQDHGEEVALNVAKRLVVFVRRAGGQSQFSPYLTPFVEPTSPVAQVQQYVLAHLTEDLTLEKLAAVARMSSRNFSRIFARDAKITPAEFVESARLDAARVMLERGTVPLKAVCYECGFRDPHHMRAVFRRRLGVSPQQYRHSFSRPGEAQKPMESSS
ncbi:GlxA family transcriptional regulator [Cupriavidus sp. 2TAF22]|uniref:GlxA family transcriptional regulator n=1 Tax=unclassified Cupriavidus TaxID=2640874 RepID=UPI003F9272BC